MTTVLPRRNPGIAVTEFDTEFVVFDPAVSQVHRIVGLEAAVFDACDGETTLDELADELAGELAGEPDGDHGLLVTEVEATLTRLGQLGLLDGTAAQPPPPCWGCQGLVDPPPPTTWQGRLRRWWSSLR